MNSWVYIYGEGYVCALPIANYQVGFIILAKVGEEAERLDYYPVITLEQTRVKLVVPEANAEKAQVLMQVVDNLLPKPQTPEAAGSSESKQKSRRKSAK